jgi:hypothetical protein
MIRVCLAVLLSFAVLAPAWAADKKETEQKTKLKGLLITGGCCHDYNNQKQIITEGLSQRVSISWDIVHEGGTGRDHKISVYKEAGWASQYDVIVHNECFGGVADDDFVKSLHSYRIAPTGADAWRELIGVTSRRHEKHRGVLVQNVNQFNPIMKDFPTEWKTDNGELYIIERSWPNCVPLAQAYGTDTKKVHPVIWTNKFGEAKVFGTSLGHHNETMNNDVWLGVVSRGLLWTVGKLDEDGNAKPGYEGTGVKPIKLPGLKPIPEKK